MKAFPPEACAQCGGTIPPRAKACPECGADERTGWRETSVYDGLDLPDEGGDAASAHGSDGKRRLLPWHWWIVGLGLLLLLGLGALAWR